MLELGMATTQKEKERQTNLGRCNFYLQQCHFIARNLVSMIKTVALNLHRTFNSQIYLISYGHRRLQRRLTNCGKTAGGGLIEDFFFFSKCRKFLQTTAPETKTMTPP